MDDPKAAHQQIRFALITSRQHHVNQGIIVITPKWILCYEKYSPTTPNGWRKALFAQNFRLRLGGGGSKVANALRCRDSRKLLWLLMNWCSCSHTPPPRPEVIRSCGVLVIITGLISVGHPVRRVPAELAEGRVKLLFSWWQIPSSSSTVTWEKDATCVFGGVAASMWRFKTVALVHQQMGIPELLQNIIMLETRLFICN